MNTGMQDACNLAWKLALVCLGTCPSEPLLASYSEERSPIGAEVLKETGRLTSLAVLRNPVLQSIRNHVAQLVLGLSPVRQKMVDTITEVSVSYPPGSLVRPRSGHHHGPDPGNRAPIRGDEPPFGSGDRPRFALCAEVGDESNRLIHKYRDLLEPTPRAPLYPDVIALVRPDGYLSVVADHEAWGEMEGYLNQFNTKSLNVTAL